MAIAQRIADHLDDTTVTLMPKVLDGTSQITPDASLVGLVFPNYFGGVPQIVLEFLQKIDFSEADYIFSVVTGGKGHGRCFGQLQQVLAEKNSRLDYGKSVLGLSNYIVGWYYSFVCKTGAERDRVLEYSSQKAVEIAKDITNRKTGVEKDQAVSYCV